MVKNTKACMDLLQAILVAAFVVCALPDLSLAQTGSLGATTSTFAKSQLIYIPNLITAVCYIGGLLLMVGGVMSLRKHAENPTGEPLAKGASKLVVGGVLAALPSFTGWLNNTIMIGGDKVQYNKLDVSGFSN